MSERGQRGVVPELEVGGAQVLVDGVQVSVVAQEHLVGGGVLQHLRHGAQVSPLLRGQLTARRHLDDVEGVGRHDGGVHVAIIQKITHNLRTQIKKQTS